jgi:3-deoxy-D-manno-octulosonic-acid transferase
MLCLPYLLWLQFKPKYRLSIPARFGCVKNPPFSEGDIWMHGCSLGEIKALGPLAKKLGNGAHVSTTTQTGFNEAKLFATQARYLPFEIFLPFWVKKHKILIVMEAELWLMLFTCMRSKGAHTMLINARISQHSFKNYKKWRWFYKMIFDQIDVVFAQTQIDKERLEILGAKNVNVNGNIKTALVPKLTCKYPKPTSRVITFASTHEGEEILLLKALEPLGGNMYCIAPRHPERFENLNLELGKYAKEHGLRYGRLSDGGFKELDILLWDKMGELINLYAITDITLLGGSFLPNIGGHNPLEPAFFENVIISGIYAFNQNALYAQVENIYEIEPSEIKSLLKEPLKVAKLSHNDALAPIVTHIKSQLEILK